MDTFAAFIDMSKAFQSVDRSFLLYKLLNYNIEGKYIELLCTWTCFAVLMLMVYSLSGSKLLLESDKVITSHLHYLISFLNDLTYGFQALNLGVKFGNYVKVFVNS